VIISCRFREPPVKVYIRDRSLITFACVRFGFDHPYRSRTRFFSLDHSVQFRFHMTLLTYLRSLTNALFLSVSLYPLDRVFFALARAKFVRFRGRHQSNFPSLWFFLLLYPPSNFVRARERFCSFVQRVKIFSNSPRA
jgi:hypothetical protein